MLTDQDEISNLYGGPSIDASYQVSIHLAKRFQRRRFLEIDQSEIRSACLLIDRNEMSNLYRGLSIDASYQVSVHLAKRFQKRRIFKISQSETSVAFSLMDRDEMSNLYRGPSKFQFIWLRGFRGIFICNSIQR